MGFDLKWQQDLKDKYTNLLEFVHYIECESGWKEIIENLLLNIHRFEASVKVENPKYRPIKLVQIKQKYGCLRVYYDFHYPYPYSDVISDMITAAELESMKTCELCGSKTNVRTLAKRSWLLTICAVCDTDYAKKHAAWFMKDTKTDEP
jgi:hypothetical protein